MLSKYVPGTANPMEGSTEILELRLGWSHERQSVVVATKIARHELGKLASELEDDDSLRLIERISMLLMMILPTAKADQAQDAVMDIVKTMEPQEVFGEFLGSPISAGVTQGFH